MKRRELNGVRLGQRVRDLDGTPLGKVVRLFEWGFAARRGLPILSRGEYVLRYDEIRAVRDGALVVSRSARDLLEHAAGEIPRAWRIPTPPAFPTAATPGEAHLVREDVAAGRIAGAAGEERTERLAEVAAEPLREDELREYVRTRGQALAPERAGTDRE